MSSYKGKFGFVQYYVKAVMERPSQPPQECRRHFEVEEPLDVNTPDLLVSPHYYYTTTIGSLVTRDLASGGSDFDS